MLSILSTVAGLRCIASRLSPESRTLVQGAHPCADELTSRGGFFEETRVHI